MYLTKLRIEDLRSLKLAEFDFQYTGNPLSPSDPEFLQNVNVFLGDNGTGKTTVLKAIVLSVLSPVISNSGFRPYFLVRRTAPSRYAAIFATVQLHQQDVEGLAQLAQNPEFAAWDDVERTKSADLLVRITRRGDYETIATGESTLPGNALENMYYEESPAFFIVAYGATRRVDDSSSFTFPEQSKSRSARYQRVAGLFENQISLVPLSTWLPDLKERNPGRFAQIEHLLNDLLPREAKFTGELIDREFEFSVYGQQVPFAALSDGYRAYISWISDLLYQINRTCPAGLKLRDNKGVVLVDEVDLHLHPEWQKSIVGVLSRNLPNLQFFFTTHSPIVAASLHRENLFVTSAGDDGASAVKQLQERIYGLSSDQALESSYFGLTTTRTGGVVEEVERLTGRSGPGDPAAALQLMERLSGVSRNEVQGERRSRGAETGA